MTRYVIQFFDFIDRLALAIFKVAACILLVNMVIQMSYPPSETLFKNMGATTMSEVYTSAAPVDYELDYLNDILMDVGNDTVY
jgi:hypothetical protein